MLTLVKKKGSWSKLLQNSTSQDNIKLLPTFHRNNNFYQVIVGWSLYCIDFLGRKINLSGLSLAKCSRSGPNSVHVDMSRGDNVQGILGAIDPFWAQLGDESCGAQVFLSDKPSDLSATSRWTIFTKFGHKTAGYRSCGALQRYTVYSTL